MSIELAKEAEALREAAGGFWEAHPDHPVESWQSEVEADDTRLGYWEWVACQIEQTQDDGSAAA
mgnify:CR=1 FL=1